MTTKKRKTDKTEESKTAELPQDYEINAVNQWGRNILPVDYFRGKEFETFMLPFMGYSNGQHSADVDRMWTSSLSALIPKSCDLKFQLVAPAASGSDANNMTFPLASYYISIGKEKRAARVLILDGCYGASKGELSHVNPVDLQIGMLRYDLADKKRGSDNICAAPWSLEYTLALRTGDHRRSLEAAESCSLSEIEAKITSASSTANPIGALLLEVVNITKMHGLSLAYLLALRALANKHHILLVVDEVMTGLKTWTPFLFMQYPGFVPDLVTFGKGFVMSGVLAVNKTAGEVKAMRYYLGETTSAMDGAVIAKSSWVMSCFQKHKLFSHILRLDGALVEHFANLSTETKEGLECWGIGIMWKSSHRFARTLMAFSRLLLVATFPLDNVALLLPTEKETDSLDDPRALTLLYSDINGFVHV